MSLVLNRWAPLKGAQPRELALQWCTSARLAATTSVPCTLGILPTCPMPLLGCGELAEPVLVCKLLGCHIEAGLVGGWRRDGPWHSSRQPEWDFRGWLSL